MAKNITIKEGATAKNFTGVKKITTNQMGGGSVSWIPEDEAADYCTFKTITARKNGTYKAEDNACDGFSEVKVEVPADVKDKVITTNGEYLAAEDNCLGYRKVTVNVSGGGSGSGQHTVLFYAADRQTILERVTVEDGGGAVYTNPLPTSPGMRFIGWSPSPVNVRADMNCYPKFENMVYDPTQIQDDWITIAQKVRQNPDAYNIGQWKMLELNGNISGEWITSADQVAVEMVLVAKGVDPLEGGNGYAPTTWMARTFISNAFNNYISVNQKVDWSNSNIRNFLQTIFTQYAFPQDLLNYVRRVVKYSTCYIDNIVTQSYPTVDWFFIPSFREVFGNNSEDLSQRTIWTVNHYFSCNAAQSKETKGAIYDIFGSDGKSVLEDQYQSLYFKASDESRNGINFPLRTWGNWDAGYPRQNLMVHQNNDGSRPNEIVFTGNQLDGSGTQHISWNNTYDTILFGFCL